MGKRVFLIYQYDLRPSAAQYAALDVLLDQTRVLYNAAATHVRNEARTSVAEKSLSR